jgi:hypothetical protein
MSWRALVLLTAAVAGSTQAAAERPAPLDPAAAARFAGLALKCLHL